jgi:hypothetical protein
LGIGKAAEFSRKQPPGSVALAAVVAVRVTLLAAGRGGRVGTARDCVRLGRWRRRRENKQQKKGESAAFIS